MGLHMKYWRLALFASLLSASSCLQPLDQGKPDYGPEVSVAEIQAKINEAIAGTDPATDIKVGQVVIYDETQVLNEQFGQVLSETMQEITGKTEDANKIMFANQVTKLTYANDGTVRKEAAEGIPLCVEKVANGCS